MKKTRHTPNQIITKLRKIETGRAEVRTVANAVRSHLSDLDVETWFIALGAPLENGYIESPGDTLRNELLSREVFGRLLEARVLGGKYRQEYDIEHPHSTFE